MKINLKKIGAIVAGAAVLASAPVVAGLMFGSTTLVDDNGAPVAKVVVGSKAQVSDGLAAALIAGKMASEAYKMQTLTATVSGTATCMPSGVSGNSTGTCSISEEKARLEITIPGASASGTWTGFNLIGDWIDRLLMDRKDRNSSDSDTFYAMGSTDTSDTANPFTDGNGGQISSGASEIYLYKIDGNAFSGFANYNTRDDQGGGSFVEMQSLWIKGDNHYEEDDHNVIGRVEFLAYQLKFDGPGGDDTGVPVCSDSVDGDYTYCKTVAGKIDKATETHRFKVMFLGEEWVISEMNAPTSGVATTDTTLVSGGSVKLAKEAVGGILNQGESLQVDNLKFQLDDLEAHGDTTSAILSVLDANGNILKKDKVDPGTTKEIFVNGKTYRFHVYKVAPGYTFGAKWADVAIYSVELELKDGQELDSGKKTNPGWKVSLAWKNRDPSTLSNKTDSLRSIILFADSIDSDVSSSGDEDLAPGDYVRIVQSPELWRLYYKGLDITSSDRTGLTFDLKTNSKTINADQGPVIGGVKRKCLILPPFVEVKSSDSGSVFEIPSRTDNSGAGSLSDNEFIVALNSYGARMPVDAPGMTNGDAGVICDSDGVAGYNGATDTTLGDGTVFMQISSSSNSDYGYLEYLTNKLSIKYQKIGDGSSVFTAPDGGALMIQRAYDVATSVNGAVNDDAIGELLTSAGYVCTAVTDCSSSYVGGNGGLTTKPTMFFALGEKAGTGSSNKFVDYLVFGTTGTGTSTSASDAKFQPGTSMGDSNGKLLLSSDDEILYGHAVAGPDFYLGPSGPVDKGVETVEDGYITERGSKFESISDKLVKFNMAHKLAKAVWFLTPTSTGTTSSNKQVFTLGEGESKDFSSSIGTITVKALEITEKVGACSAAGGAPSCTAKMDGVSAVIMPNNAASVTVAMPYTGNYWPLVMLDSEAQNVQTVVSVGGDKVNTVTAKLFEGAKQDWAANKKVVKEVVQGSKIVVAGAEAPDTLAAAQDFVSQVTRKK